MKDPDGDEQAARTLAVIAKEPVPGRVKTRLSPPLSADEAARVASACLADTIAAVDEAAAAGMLDRKVLYVEGNPAGMVGGDWEVIQQCGGALGERLDALFAQMAGPSVVVGMDTPQLDRRAISAALCALGDNEIDAVFGPASDGGYWTIGFDRYVPGAFDGVVMSEADTGAQQLRRLSDLGLRVEVLDTLRDIDLWADALEVADRYPGLRVAEVVRAARRGLHTSGTQRSPR